MAESKARAGLATLVGFGGAAFLGAAVKTEWLATVIKENPQGSVALTVAVLMTVFVIFFLWDGRRVERAENKAEDAERDAKVAVAEAKRVAEEAAAEKYKVNAAQEQNKGRMETVAKLRSFGYVAKTHGDSVLDEVFPPEPPENG